MKKPDAWSVINRERGRLIDLNIAGTISASDSRKLAALQAYADEYLEEFDGGRLDAVLDKLEARVKEGNI